jgi:hypothetical protein
LARSNKSRTGTGATKRGEALPAVTLDGGLGCPAGRRSSPARPVIERTLARSYVCRPGWCPPNKIGVSKGGD